MAKILHGEIPLRIGGKMRVLRPSLGAIYEIEQELGATVPELISLIKDGNAPGAIIRCILAQGFAACPDNSAPFSLPAWKARRRWPVALAFLIHGLGFIIEEEKESTPAPDGGEVPPAKPKPPLSFEPIPWEKIYKTARTMLGVGEAEFWHMTMPALSLLTAAAAEAAGVHQDYNAFPATGDDLAWMMAQHPDETPAAAT